MSASLPPVDEGASAPEGPRRRMGRPPRISRAQIAEAALELGLSDLTLRAVADHLGVTVGALYHHIEGKNDLMRLAADRSATRLVVPVDIGQHWTAWLLEWAEYNRVVFAADAALFGQFVDGAVSPSVIAAGAEAILAVLVRQGFTVEEAHRAFELVTACAIGLAVASIRERRSAERGDPSPAEQLRLVAEQDPEALPLMLALAEERAADPDHRALVQLRTVVLALARERGEDPSRIDVLLDEV